MVCAQQRDPHTGSAVCCSAVSRKMLVVLRHKAWVQLPVSALQRVQRTCAGVRVMEGGGFVWALTPALSSESEACNEPNAEGLGVEIFHDLLPPCPLPCPPSSSS